MRTRTLESEVGISFPELVGVNHNEELWRRILDYDLSVVTTTFATRHPEYADSARELELECKRFMYLAAIAPTLDLAPTKPIDEYWHQFVLFTETYTNFCAEITGYFVHHNPLAGPDHAKIFSRTQELVQKIFGVFEGLRLWLLPMPATSCKCTNGKIRPLMT